MTAIISLITAAAVLLQPQACKIGFYMSHINNHNVTSIMISLFLRCQKGNRYQSGQKLSRDCGQPYPVELEKNRKNQNGSNLEYQSSQKRNQR